MIIASTFPLFPGILTLLYALIILYSIVRILLDTHSTSKTLAYLLLVLVLPVLGVIIYFSFGINYRHKKADKKGATSLNELASEFKDNVIDQTSALSKEPLEPAKTA